MRLSHRAGLAVSVFLLMTTPFGILAFNQWQMANVVETRSTLASLAASLGSIDAPHWSEIGWHQYTDSEYKSAISSLLEANESLDLGNSTFDSSNRLVGMWGNRFQIAVRQTGDGKLQFIVSSIGPDGKQGTDDDIVFPDDANGEQVLNSQSEKKREKGTF